MNAWIGKTPFARLLIPVVAGIATGSMVHVAWTVVVALCMAGLLLTAASFGIHPKDQYRLRWVFGAGIIFFLFSLSLLRFGLLEESTILSTESYGQYRLGVVLDIPETKARSVAVNVKTAPPDVRKVILYLAPTDEANGLRPGDEIVFLSKVTPFRNFGNPDDFDYVRHMKTKGFAGSGFVPADDWRKTGRKVKSIPLVARQIRAQALDFYRSFGLESDAYAFICALTLGYGSFLSDELNSAFRVSGTAHVLSVSGLHVLVIYAIILMMFSFLGKSGKSFVMRQCLVIVVLWGYAFLTGMLAPVIRAALMLSIVCLGNMLHKKGITYNTLAAAAFCILIFEPSYLLDASFQMSFLSVWGILFFQPKFNALYSPANKVAKYVWNLFTVSISAQLAVFPLVLYYFGTFPTYFFLTNLLVAPLTGLIIYTVFPTVILGALAFLHWEVIGWLQDAFNWILKNLIEMTLRIVYFAESIPFAQISDLKISFLQLVLLFLLIFAVTRLLSSRNSPPLIASLATLLFFQCTVVYEEATCPAPQLTVFNRPGQSEIALFHNHRREFIEIAPNGIVPHFHKRILRLSDATFNTSHTECRFPVDVLILSRYGAFNTRQLNALFRPVVIVLDSSMPRYAAGRIATECAALGIRVHDVVENGAFSLNF